GAPQPVSRICTWGSTACACGVEKSSRTTGCTSAARARRWWCCSSKRCSARVAGRMVSTTVGRFRTSSRCQVGGLAVVLPAGRGSGLPDHQRRGGHRVLHRLPPGDQLPEQAERSGTEVFEVLVDRGQGGLPHRT